MWYLDRSQNGYPIISDYIRMLTFVTLATSTHNLCTFLSGRVVGRLYLDLEGMDDVLVLNELLVKSESRLESNCCCLQRTDRLLSLQEKARLQQHGPNQ